MKKQWMRWLAMLLLFAMVAPMAAVALAQDVPQEACVEFADIALVARAAAVSNIPVEQTASLIGHVYGFPNQESMQAAAAVLGMAYRDSRTPEEFAKAFFNFCRRGQ